MKIPAFKSITKLLLGTAVALTLATAGWGLFNSFSSPLSTQTKEDTKQEVAIAKVDLAKHVCLSPTEKGCADKTLSRVLNLNTEFDVIFKENYVKLNEDCTARSRTRDYSYGEDYKENESVNNPFSPRAIVDPGNPVCAPR